MSTASLGLASEFKRTHRLNDCNFLQANLFELPLQEESFDLVICKGVLHHTADARAAFRAACRLAKPGGYVLVGLYNRIGRIPTSLRRWYFKLTRRGQADGDYVLRQITQSDEKARSWFYDQYLHPHETRHTVDEVLEWFRENELGYVNAVPGIRLGDGFDPSLRLFDPLEPGNRFEHLLVQTSLDLDDFARGSAVRHDRQERRRAPRWVAGRGARHDRRTPGPTERVALATIRRGGWRFCAP